MLVCLVESLLSTSNSSPLSVGMWTCSTQYLLSAMVVEAVVKELVALLVENSVSDTQDNS